MSRSQRLFDLLQLLRCHKYPVTGDYLARELNVSVRTIYRDIATLQGQGAEIDGEAGLGYVLKPGFTLPPLMFTPDELEVLRLGAEWIAQQADSEFSASARHAIAKIAAVLPQSHTWQPDDEIMRVGPLPAMTDLPLDMALLRAAIRHQAKIDLDYRDGQGKLSQRCVWPLLIGVFQQCYVLVAWCEQREDFRHFRLDRIARFAPQAERYPHPRKVLLRQWRQASGIPTAQLGY
ncbi:YafY family protein [Photobacterium sp. MCCC 1A19761]|uniref:helix-turn-helix transcriptional regulator n=1 Tax=unclassified Photobacterium TaxID=2628852 RepID=UPI0021BE0B75|nr:YafY family protein [Photobacterium sp. TY1-4]UXI03159.1 YafY family transcriptional regulator [Photobacterium sp. TY1-4]